MSKVQRVGIISANWGIAAHLPAWRANPDVEVVGICTAHQETAEKAASANGIPMAFWDYREMAKHPDIDIIDVGTRPNLRYEMCMAAFAAGKHVYNGIPFADSMAHARDLGAAQVRSGKVGSVDAYSEYLPPIAFAKELIEEGAVGDLYSVTCTLQSSLFNTQVSTFPYNWFWKKEAGCSALRNLGSHALNVLYYLFGEVESVVAQNETCLKEWKFVDNSEVVTPQIEDTANVLLRFARGGMGVLAPAWCAIGGRGFLVDAFGSKGRLVIESPMMPSNAARVSLARLGEMSPTELAVPDRFRERAGIGLTARPDSPVFMGPHFAMALSFADMLESIRTGRGSRPGFAQAVHTHAAIEAADRSALENRWVRVSEMLA
ncbi:MAG: Gfo/Idh/MocA family oxidoreductase [Vicinamibacterales bacterium]|nr:Gfo/Idh/MocA family oxidoreductase [Vicinamibacterales bacterium]